MKTIEIENNSALLKIYDNFDVGINIDKINHMCSDPKVKLRLITTLKDLTENIEATYPNRHGIESALFQTREELKKCKQELKDKEDNEDDDYIICWECPNCKCLESNVTYVAATLNFRCYKCQSTLLSTFRCLKIPKGDRALR